MLAIFDLKLVAVICDRSFIAFLIHENMGLEKNWISDFYLYNLQVMADFVIFRNGSHNHFRLLGYSLWSYNANDKFNEFLTLDNMGKMGF